MGGIRACATALVLGLFMLLPGVAAAKAKDNDQHVQVLAINDLHGNVEPPAGSSGRIPVGLNPDGTVKNVDAGGVEYLKTWVDKLRAQPGHNQSLFVGAGDLIGASPLTSGLFHDEPTIEALNAIGMDWSSVGNHEFDEGIDELQRMQNGGCHPVDGCQDGDPFTGAAFQYLAANVFLQNTNRTLLPPYQIRKVGKYNVKVAFIGLTLKGTPLIVTPSGVAGLDFRDEVQTINDLVRRLRASDGVRAFVVLIHQGGQQNTPFTDGYMN